MRVPSRGELLVIAWPVIVANATVPTLGLVDAAVIGHTGTVAELGAIALGALWLAGGVDYDALWWAFIAYVVARAVALGLYFPALRRSIPAAAGIER